MSRSISVGIDIGSQHVKVVVVELLESNPTTSKQRKEYQQSQNKGQTRVLGTGISVSHGVKHGYVNNPEECSESVITALRVAEKSTGIKIKRVNTCIGGVGLLGHIFHGAININKNVGEVTASDIFKVQENAKTEIPKTVLQNRMILHSFPLYFKIDGKTVLGNPEGLKCTRFEVKIFSITTLTHHLNDLVNAIEDADVGVDDVIAGPLLVSANSISKVEKKAGVGIVNIRSETVSIIVFDDNMPISLEILPIGSNDITNDIALGLKISLEEAESVKLGQKSGLYSRKKIDEIISARLSDIFELVDNHLNKIGKSGLLPAGIVLLGGGSKMPGIENFASSYLKLPIRKIEDKPEWVKAYGAAMYGLFPEDIIGPEETLFSGWGGWVTKTLLWFKQFLP